MQKIYFLGIGGIAMANLACLLKEKGYLISGSDVDTFGPSADLLKKHKIGYFKDHSPVHIKKFKPDVIIAGNAIQRDNLGLEYILNQGIPYQSMPEAVKSFLIENKTSTGLSSRKSIVIAGTSGKTTTAALVAWILKEAGLKPTALVGGIMKNTDSGFMDGGGNYVVVEGDEYGSSFYDPSPKFLHYRPYFSIITNIQPDHLDIYGNMENVFKAFQKLVKVIPGKGSLVLNKTNQYTVLIAQEAKSKVVTFGKNGNIWANSIKSNPEGLSFVVYNGTKRLGKVKSRLFGKHNIENILAAVAIALEIKIPFSKISQAVSSFEGVKRRLEIIFRKNNTTVIDDFAHNPEKVSASLSALRSHFPKHKIIAIFEPRTGSSRRKFFQDAYLLSFKNADLVYIADPFKKEALKKEEVFSSRQLAKDLNKNPTKRPHHRGAKAYALKNADAIVSHIKSSKLMTDGYPAILIVMSSGEFDGIHQKLIDLIKEKPAG